MSARADPCSTSLNMCAPPLGHAAHCARQWLQTHSAEANADGDTFSALQLSPNDASTVPEPSGWGSGGFMHAGGGMFPYTQPIRAARTDDPMTRVTDRVFAAHDRRRRADQK